MVAKGSVLDRRRFVIGTTSAGFAVAAGMKGIYGEGASEKLTFVKLPDPLAKGNLIWDASPLGYEVEEYLVSGNGPTFAPMSPTEAGKSDRPDPNVPWSQRDKEYAGNLPADFSARPQTGTGSYTTRIMVYRPRDMKKFSGNVVFEAVHPAGELTLWSQSNHVLLKRGDVVIHIEAPGRLNDLKKMSPERYGPLSMPDRSVFWSAISQIATVIESGGSNSPVPARARHMYFTGYSGSADYVYIFLSYHHKLTRTASGGPVFDGYLPMSVCRPVPAIDAVIVTVATENDMFGNASGDSAAAHVFRKTYNSDAPNARRRRYEMPGPFHGDNQPPVPGMAIPPRNHVPSDGFSTCAVNLKWPTDAMPNYFPRRAMLESCFHLASRWVEAGVAPPTAPLIETDESDKVLLDENGNARGGLRFPDISVPVDTFVPAPREGEVRCRSIGYRQPFSREKMVTLYGNREKYLAQYDAAVDKLAKDGFILPDGAAQMKSERSWLAPVF
jgi:Alpha/beta hydrolase domain